MSRSKPPPGETWATISGFPSRVSGFIVETPGWDYSTLCSSSENLRSSNNALSSDHTPSTGDDNHCISPSTQEPEQSKFAFVHHTGPSIEDRESRRLIKRHVMVDIGKSRRKQPIPKKRSPGRVQLPMTGERDFQKGIETIDIYMPGQSLPSISHFGTTRDPFMAYPIKMTRQTLALVDHLCDEAHPEMKLVRESFFPVGLEDPAAFHQLLAVLAKHLPAHRSEEFSKSADYERKEIITHHTKAIELVKCRMADIKAATSDGTIGAIVLMICHSYMDEDFEMWHQHMRGLKLILQMREKLLSRSGTENDGIGSRGLSPSLQICLGWIDTTGSMGQDTHPVFPFHEHLFPLYPDFPSWIILPESVSALEIVFAETFLDLTLIRELFIDVVKFTIFSEAMSRTERNFWIKDATFATKYFEPLTYRLLSIRDPVNRGDLSSVLQEMMRLSLILFLGPVRRKLGVHCITMNVQVSRLLALLLQPIEFGVNLDDLKLWIITIGAMEARDTEMKGQFNSILVELLMDMEIYSLMMWEESLKRLIWLDEVHDVRLRILWKDLN